MKIKVCGIRYLDNIAELAELPVDMMGMIFYPQSSRYIGKLSSPEIDAFIQYTTKNGIDRVGVFVNEDIETVLETVDKYALDWVQVHGDESPQYVRELNKRIPVIRALSISGKEDIEKTNDYKGLFGYFLFDTKTGSYGGSGKKFDWSLLDLYNGTTPFLLSGGISADDADEILRIDHSKFYGVDLNSRFETEVGKKDIALLKKFIKKLANE